MKEESGIRNEEFRPRYRANFEFLVLSFELTPTLPVLWGCGWKIRYPKFREEGWEFLIPHSSFLFPLSSFLFPDSSFVDEVAEHLEPLTLAWAQLHLRYFGSRSDLPVERQSFLLPGAHKLLERAKPTRI